MDSFNNICKVKEISFVLTSIKITLLVKFNMQGQFHKQTKDELNSKLNKELKISEYDNYDFDKFTYEKLDRNLTIIEKG